MQKLITLIAVLLLTGCMGASFENVTPDKAKELIEGMSEDLDKDKSYLLVCRSGNRSQQAAELLTANGFKNVFNMTGGMNEWTYEIE
jgi:rhodanese-related sulfurtransferase